MIEYKRGDLLREDVEAIVNTVNCVGVMGRGIALQFKKAFPENFRAYVAACNAKAVHPGKMFVFETGQLINPRLVINFPTKRHWREKSRMEDIESGLGDLAEQIRRRHIRSIAVPPLGCGLGGLDWRQVRQRIETALQSIPDVRIMVFEPEGAPAAEKMVHYQKPPVMTAGRAALVGLMRRYLDGLLDPFITLLEVHKLMYFLQAAGEPLRLEYTSAHYGPYARNLGHVFHKIEGHLISGYADGGDEPGKNLSLVAGAAENAAQFLKQHPETLDRVDRVADLVEGFETPFGLELLSTVHWVIKDAPALSEDDVASRIYGWNERKQKFTRRQIARAMEVLVRKGWIEMLQSEKIA